MYRLEKGMNFSRVDGRAVFLDEGRDRYICLKPTTQVALNKLLDGADLCEEDYKEFGVLKELGILTLDSVAPKLASPKLTLATRLLDTSAVKPPAKEVFKALGWRLSAGLSLKLHGLEATLNQLRLLKNGLLPIEDRGDEDLAIGLAAAFQATHRIISANNRCLTHAIALYRQLMVRQYRAEFVIGVRLNPFGAHCWVQMSDEIVCDTAVFVRQFTPILVI